MKPLRPVLALRGAAAALVALVALVALTAGAVASPAAAQAVELRGRGDIENDTFLRRLIDRGDWTLVARDTLLRHNDTIPGMVVIAGVTVRIEGVITGDLVIVDANVFLRPSARVLGDVRNIGGGLYASELATVAGGTRSEPNAPYRVLQRDDGTVTVQGVLRPDLFVTDGLFGLRAPTYDRVDGLMLGLGAAYLLPRVGSVEPRVRGRVEYRSQRGVITGGAELDLPRGRSAVTVGAERTTLTNERWIQTDVENSITYFLGASDRRDYYEADRVYLELRSVLEAGPRNTTVFLRGQLEDGRTLGAGAPWTIWGSPRQDNMVIADSRIASALAGLTVDWSQAQHEATISGVLEVAGRQLDGEHAFKAFVTDVDWAMAGFRDHTLAIRSHVRAPLPGTRSLPPQRWSFVGGTGTLPTFHTAAFRGDRVAFVETLYSIPTRVQLRFIGSPDFEVLHAAGMAWTADGDAGLEQNIGAGLRFAILSARVLVDPRHTGSDRLRFVVDLEMPRPRRPWHPE
jgi:hypothetical protein